MKFIKFFLLFLIGAVLFILFYFFVGNPPKAKEIKWGISFSQKHSADFGLDWKKNYLAIIDDLGVEKIRILTHWDLIEKKKDNYEFEDLDFQIEEAQKRNVEIILVVGMKTGRWPECHIPSWTYNLGKIEQQERILKLLEKIVLRYKNSSAIKYWQIENEPFFAFGDCPWYDKEFLKKEIEKVRSIDDLKRPIIVTESGEWSLWFSAAKIADVVGITMYREAWIEKPGFYFNYPLSPGFYWRKNEIIDRLFRKKIMVVELQAEPWGPKLLYDLPLEEQLKTMNLEKFRENTEFAKSTGLDEFYLWGAEWWYWLKEKQASPEIWEQAKKLFKE